MSDADYSPDYYSGYSHGSGSGHGTCNEHTASGPDGHSHGVYYGSGYQDETGYGCGSAWNAEPGPDHDSGYGCGHGGGAGEGDGEGDGKADGQQ